MATPAAAAVNDFSIDIKSGKPVLNKLRVVAISGHERLSRPYRFIAELRWNEDDGSPSETEVASWMDEAVCLIVSQGPDKGHFHGMVDAIEWASSSEGSLIRIELVPRLWKLSFTKRHRVFAKKTVSDVVKEVLSSHGVTPPGWNSAGVRQNITQYDETDLAFVSRLLEELGACYWFEHSEGGHSMHIADSAGAFPGPGKALEGWMGQIQGLTLRREVVARKVRVTQYSEQDPGHPTAADLDVKEVKVLKAKGTMAGKLEEGEFHSFLTAGEVDVSAKRAADEQRNHSARWSGVSDMPTMHAGVRVAVPEKKDEHFLVVGVEHRWRYEDESTNQNVKGSLAERGMGAYENAFWGIPTDSLPWRPPRETPIPRIHGIIPGMVTATAGDQTNLDSNAADGTYAVKLLQGDGQAASRPVRMAQPYAGAQQGFHFPLPVGTEVALAHINGHPDRPVIAGAMINAETASPVKEANKTQCVIQTASGHKLTFEDKKDEESITLVSKKTNTLCFDDANEVVKLLAAKDYATTVEHDATLTIKGKSDTAITGDRTEKIDGKQELTVKGDVKTAIDGKSDLAVKGDATAEVTGKVGLKATGETKVESTGKLTVDGKNEISLTATSKLTLTCGGASITLEPSGKIEIKGTQIEINGAQIKLKGSGMVEVAADASLSLKGAMVEVSANASLDLKSSGMLNAQGSLIKLN